MGRFLIDTLHLWLTHKTSIEAESGTFVTSQPAKPLKRKSSSSRTTTPSQECPIECSWRTAWTMLWRMPSEEAKRSHCYSLISIKFRMINGTFGHAFGDLVLKEVAGRLGRCAWDQDSVARVGAEEFLVFASKK